MGHNQVMDEERLVEEIKETLAKYRPSDETRDVLAQARVLLLVGMTGAGKQRIIQELLKTNKYYFIVSHTTRPPRSNNGVPERDGVEYFFVSNQNLLQMLKKGEFVECKFIHNQQFSGTSVKELRRATAEGKIATTDIEVQGVEEYMNLKPDTAAVFILPPSFEEWERRLNDRGRLHADELANRYKSAAMEIEMALDKDYYHFVVNDDLESAVKAVDSIAQGQGRSEERQHSGTEVAKTLLKRLR